MSKSEIIKEMAQDLGHCGEIASSAIVLATERSLDINVPMVVTLIMLKKLCEANIEQQMDVRDMPKVTHELAALIGKDLPTIQKEAKEQLESMIDDYFKWSMAKREVHR